MELPSLPRSVWILHGILDIHDSYADRKLNQLGNILELQLLHNVGPVGFNSTRANAQNI